MLNPQAKGGGSHICADEIHAHVERRNSTYNSGVGHMHDRDTSALRWRNQGNNVAIAARDPMSVREKHCGLTVD